MALAFAAAFNPLNLLPFIKSKGNFSGFISSGRSDQGVLCLTSKIKLEICVSLQSIPQPLKLNQADIRWYTTKAKQADIMPEIMSDNNTYNRVILSCSLLLWQLKTKDQDCSSNSVRRIGDD